MVILESVQLDIRRERAKTAKVRFFKITGKWDSKSQLQYLVCDANAQRGKKTLAKCFSNRVAEMVLRSIRADYIRTGKDPEWSDQ